MKKIEKNKDRSSYISNSLIDKHLYMKKETTEFYCYYIFVPSDIIINMGSYDVTYNCSKCFLLSVPRNNESERKAYLYETYTSITIDSYSDELYEMSFQEFIDTFRSFIECDGKYVSEMPDKIIKD